MTTPLDIFRLVVLWIAVSSAAPHTGCTTTGPQLTSATECWIVNEQAGTMAVLRPDGISYELRQTAKDHRQ